MFLLIMVLVAGGIDISNGEQRLEISNVLETEDHQVQEIFAMLQYNASPSYRVTDKREIQLDQLKIRLSYSGIP